MVSGSAERIAPKAADFGLIGGACWSSWGWRFGKIRRQFFPLPCPYSSLWICRVSRHSGLCCRQKTLQRDRQLKEIQKELEVARRIQLSILPSEFPASTNFRVAARYLPMTSVAGDLYDYIIADDHQVGLFIADGQGTVFPPLLLHLWSSSRQLRNERLPLIPCRFLSGMNSALLGNTQDQFVTAAYVHLNSE